MHFSNFSPSVLVSRVHAFYNTFPRHFPPLSLVTFFFPGTQPLNNFPVPFFRGSPSQHFIPSKLTNNAFFNFFTFGVGQSRARFFPSSKCPKLEGEPPFPLLNDKEDKNER